MRLTWSSALWGVKVLAYLCIILFEGITVLKSILIGSATGILLSGTAAVGLAMLFPAPAGNTPPAAPQMDVPIANVDPSGDRDVAALDVLTDQPKTEEAPAPQVIADTADDPQADSTPLDDQTRNLLRFNRPRQRPISRFRLIQQKCLPNRLWKWNLRHLWLLS